MPRSWPADSTFLPLTLISPASGVSSPAIAETSVVLPLPEKPTMATNSPASMERLTSWSTSLAPYDLLKPSISRMAMCRVRSAACAEREQALQAVHHAVEQEADETDGEYRHHDSRERVGAAVLELVPDEFSEAGVLGQHFGGDEHHPTHPERQAQAGEDQRQ